MNHLGFLILFAFPLQPWWATIPPATVPSLDHHVKRATPKVVKQHRKRKPHKIPKPFIAVREAIKHLGTWYRWGGSSPRTGFDCSGLVQYAWAKAGVRLPRTTWDQIRVGIRVKGVRFVRPGDILFPHRGHEQMAIGRGRAIEAAHTGTRIRIVPLRRYYIAIRRPR